MNSSNQSNEWVAVAHPLVEYIPVNPCLVNWPKVADGMGYTLVRKPDQITPGDDICFPIDDTPDGGRNWMYYGIVEATEERYEECDMTVPVTWVIITSNRGRYRRTVMGLDDIVFFKPEEAAGV